MITREAAYKKLAEAKPTGAKGPYLDRGAGRVVITRVEEFDTRAKELWFKATFQIETNTPTGIGASDVMYTPGTEVGFTQCYSWDLGPGNIVAFLMAATGNPQSDFSSDPLLVEGKPVLKNGQVVTKLAAAMDQILGPDQPLRGVVVDFRVTKIVTEKKKITIYPPSFSHVQQTTEQVAAKRAQLDAAAKA